MKLFNFLFYSIIGLILIVLAFGLGYLIIGNDHSRININDTPSMPLSNVRDMPLDAPTDSIGMESFQTFDATKRIGEIQYISNDEFNGYVEVFNNYNITNQYLVMALLDYQIIPFNYDGETRKQHVLNISANKGYIAQFNITNISPGFHDLIIFTIQNPYDHYMSMSLPVPYTNTSNTYKMWNQYVYMIKNSFNIINKDDGKPVVNFSSDSITNKTSNSFGISTSKEPLSSPNMTKTIEFNATENSTYNYYINVENGNSSSNTFAIIEMMDDEQIPINDNATANAYYCKLGTDAVTSIPTSVKIGNGTHELIVMMVTEPYETIEVSPGTLNPDVSNIIARRIQVNADTP